jgi:hypothetical protein
MFVPRAALSGPSPSLNALDTSPLTWHNLFHTVEGMVAFGTLLLAAVTSLLAAFTYRMASKTKTLADSTVQEIDLSQKTLEAIQRQSASAEAQVGVAQGSLAASFRPVLISVPSTWPGFHGIETVSFINGPTIDLDETN